MMMIVQRIIILFWCFLFLEAKYFKESLAFSDAGFPQSIIVRKLLNLNDSEFHTINARNQYVPLVDGQPIVIPSNNEDSIDLPSSSVKDKNVNLHFSQTIPLLDDSEKLIGFHQVSDVHFNEKKLKDKNADNPNVSDVLTKGTYVNYFENADFKDPFSNKYIKELEESAEVPKDIAEKETSNKNFYQNYFENPSAKDPDSNSKEVLDKQIIVDRHGDISIIDNINHDQNVEVPLDKISQTSDDEINNENDAISMVTMLDNISLLAKHESQKVEHVNFSASDIDNQKDRTNSNTFSIDPSTIDEELRLIEAMPVLLEIKDSHNLDVETVTENFNDSEIDTNFFDVPEDNITIKAFTETSTNSFAIKESEVTDVTTSELPLTIINEELTTPEMKKPDLNSNFKSLVFNPVAQPHERFQECTTPNNETGNCRYLQHCMLPNIVSSLDQFMKYVCIIQEVFIGVCCPEFPVETLLIKGHDIIDGPVEVPQECGVSSKTRIIGGDKADPKAWPWMAALLVKSNGKFFCGGAIINNRYVLTAAHCTVGVPGNEIIARLGEYDFRDKENSTHEDYPVVQIKRHGQFSRGTLRNDIALLKLGRPVKFNEFVGTICLPEKNDDYVGENGTLAGWGNIQGGGPKSQVLLEASLPANL